MLVVSVSQIAAPKGREMAGLVLQVSGGWNCARRVVISFRSLIKMKFAEWCHQATSRLG